MRLLNKGADVNIRGGQYGNSGQCDNALQAAAWAGIGADVNIEGGRHGNALQAAALPANVDAVQLLLNSGANSNTYMAMHCKQQHMVEIWKLFSCCLVQEQIFMPGAADMEQPYSRTQKGPTTVFPVVELLLDHGADKRPMCLTLNLGVPELLRSNYGAR